VTIVVDSNIVAAMVLPAPCSPGAIRKMDEWNEKNELLIAPTLFEYELTSLIRRSVRTGNVEEAEAEILLQVLLNLGVVTIVPDQALHGAALHLAKRIHQSKAYDAHYLALASRENAAFWTADQRLAQAAQTTGLSWVHWIGE
jgi:predicted nucleic acid-binding protein